MHICEGGVATTRSFLTKKLKYFLLFFFFELSKWIFKQISVVYFSFAPHMKRNIKKSKRRKSLVCKLNNVLTAADLSSFFLHKPYFLFLFSQDHLLWEKKKKFGNSASFGWLERIFDDLVTWVVLFWISGI